jgi:hypothetical protein
MAKKRGRKGGPSIRSIFMEYFKEHPEWVASASNELVFKKFQDDHPNIPFDNSVRQSAANAKSSIKKAKGLTSSRVGRKKAVAESKIIVRTQSPRSAMELLEESIDNALVLARQINDSKLGDVVKGLHRARNRVIYILEG